MAALKVLATWEDGSQTKHTIKIDDDYLWQPGSRKGFEALVQGESKKPLKDWRTYEYN